MGSGCIIWMLIASSLFSNCFADLWFGQPDARINFGEPTKLHTRGNKLFNEAWYTVEDRSIFIFSVKACAEAYLLLTSYPMETDGFGIEIALGGGGNTRSWIKNRGASDNLFKRRTDQLLHCNDFRSFWIQWTDSSITVGRGPVVGEQKMMGADDVEASKITSIGIASDRGNAAVWEVRENSADQLLVFTPDEHKYESMWKSISNRNYFSFSIMAAAHAHIVLAEAEGQTNANVVEFILGGWDNNRTAVRGHIYGSDTGGIKERAETPGILSKTEFRDFWVSWMNGSMELGYGLVYGKDRIIRWQDPRKVMPRYLSVTTGHGVVGDWLIQDDQDNTNYITTPKSESENPFDWFTKIWIEAARRHFFTFQVRACSDALIVLSDFPGINPDFSIEIAIGFEQNTKTVFRHIVMPGGENIAEADTFGILNCNNTRHFWMSWYDGKLRLGNWHIYDRNIILEADVGEGYDVRAIGLATPYDDNGIWVVREQYGERIHMESPATFDLDQLWRAVNNEDYFAFRVKACSDVHVGVAPTTGVDASEIFYDIVISGWENSRTQIRKVLNGIREDVSEAVDTEGLLDCEQFVDLWISWTDNIVQVGRGIIPRHGTILSHPMDEVYPIKAVSISTGFGHSGEWIIDNDNGDYMMYYTNVNANENSIGLVPGIKWITFNVRACGNAKIFLQSSSNTGEHYEITLGDEGNTISTIYARGTQVVSEETPDLLSCDNDRYLWISWEGGVLSVGTGTLYGLYEFMQYTDPNPIDVELMHFHSRDTSDLNCRWRMYYNQAMWTSFKTPENHGYHYVWQTVEHKQGLVFSVQACSDVHLILSDVIRDVDDKYDIAIGGWQNTRSAIRTAGKVEYVGVATPDLNSCNEQRSFWVSWQNGAIEVGKGEILGQDRFMDFQPLMFYPVRAVGFSTGYSYNGTWNIKLAEELLPTAPPPTDEPDDNNGDNTNGGLSGGAIAGIVIGVLLAVIFVILTVTVVFRGSLTMPVNLACLSSPEAESAPIAPDNNAPEQSYVEPDVEQPEVREPEDSQA